MEILVREMYGNFKKSVSNDIGLIRKVSEYYGIYIAGRRKIFMARTFTEKLCLNDVLFSVTCRSYGARYESGFYFPLISTDMSLLRSLPAVNSNLFLSFY